MLLLCERNEMCVGLARRELTRRQDEWIRPEDLVKRNQEFFGVIEVNEA